MSADLRDRLQRAAAQPVDEPDLVDIRRRARRIRLRRAVAAAAAVAGLVLALAPIAGLVAGGGPREVEFASPDEGQAALALCLGRGVPAAGEGAAQLVLAVEATSGAVAEWLVERDGVDRSELGPHDHAALWAERPAAEAAAFCVFESDEIDAPTGGAEDHPGYAAVVVLVSEHGPAHPSMSLTSLEVLDAVGTPEGAVVFDARQAG